MRSKKKQKKTRDFQKVKLKVGRKLPRPANETETQFKVKAISIRGQFKKPAETTTSVGDTQAATWPRPRKAVDIKELLKHCSHRGASFRLSALTELSTAFAASPRDLVPCHLGAMLGAIGAMFADDDSKVRAEARKLLRAIAEQHDAVALSDVAPFFPLLVSHLCCAMTHIHEDIRLDSLLVLDITLDRFSALVASSAVRLLPNFIGLIAQPRHVRADASGHRQQKASSSSALIINPNSQLSTQKWRLRVLRRLGKFFGAVARETRCHGNGHGTAVEKMCIAVDDGGHLSAPCCLRSPIEVGRSVLGDFALHANASESAVVTSSDSVAKVQSWLQSLLPLLIDCWVEAGAGTSPQRSNLSAESLTLLHHIVAVVQPLFEYITSGLEQAESLQLMEWLRTNYTRKFALHFMANFPYRASSDWLPKKPKIDTEIPYKPSSFTSTNLSLCLVITYLLGHGDGSYNDAAMPQWSTAVSGSSRAGPSDSVNTMLTTVVDYVVDALGKNRGASSSLSVDHLELIFCLVERLVRSQIAPELRILLLKACCNAANAASGCEPSSTLSKAWFKFMYMFVFDSRTSRHILADAEVEKWIASLPRLLLCLGQCGDDAVTDVLAAVLKAGTRQYACFLRSFDEHLTGFLDHSFVTRLGSELSGRLIESFSWVPCISPECFRRLGALCMDGTLPATVVRKLLGILQYRCSTCSTGSSQLEADQLILLMLSILLRATVADMKRVEDRYLGHVEGRGACLFVVHDEECMAMMCDKWSDQLQLIECVFDIVLMMSDQQHVLYLIAAFINHVLTSHRVLTLLTACAAARALIHLSYFNRNNNIDPIESDPVSTTASVALVRGLCLCLNDLDPEAVIASGSLTNIQDKGNDGLAAILQQTEGQLRTILEVVLSLISASPAQPLGAALKELIASGLLRDSVAVHLSAGISDLAAAT